MHAMPWLAMELCVGMFVYLISARVSMTQYNTICLK